MWVKAGFCWGSVGEGAFLSGCVGKGGIAAGESRIVWTLWVCWQMCRVVSYHGASIGDIQCTMFRGGSRFCQILII